MYHYKDRTPEETISRIKQILKRAGIAVEESPVLKAAGAFCSLELGIKGTGFSVTTNGKGISVPLARASAYAEFMERVQNQLIFLRFASFDGKFDRSRGFYNSPDETHPAPSRFEKELPVQLRLKAYAPSVIFGAKKASCVPVYSLKREKTIQVPLDFITRESNGMCAGNSPAEALVGGISELMERYVLREIFFNNVTPPTIPPAYLAKYFPKQLAAVRAVEKKGKVKIIVKDCSLGRGLPVIGAVMIDSGKRGYYVKLGAHPDPRIALERSLSELFQGRKLGDFDFIPFKKKCVKDLPTWNAVLVDGSGAYPKTLFKKIPSYPFRGAAIRSFNSNRDAFAFLDDLTKKLGWEVLVRDVSFLGFPSYKIIIPEATDATLKMEDRYAKTRHKLKSANARVLSLLRRLDKCSPKEMTEIIEYMENGWRGVIHKFSDLLRVPFNYKYYASYAFDNLFLGILYVNTGQTEKAVTYFNRRAEECQPHMHKALAPLFKCAGEYLALRRKNSGMGKVMAALKKRYTAQVADVVAHVLLFGQKTSFPCPDCAACRWNEECRHLHVLKIRRRVKKLLAASRVKQDDLKRHVF